ncbi:MAG: SIR2 family protein, partial [Acetobacter sp.]|nr:SIR2 family protein [Acetobacter sp.]
DDYEKYHMKYGKFIDVLTCDLMSKTFLFIGFSFTDPNIDYVLGQMRTIFDNNQRQHYCFSKTRTKHEGESDNEFNNARIKQELAIKELERFHITTLLIDDYSDITEILKRIELQYRQRTIFISGSAEEYGDWTKQEAEEFLCDLSRNLINKRFRIATGVGLGIGNSIITGAIEQIYRNNDRVEDWLIMRPFPQKNSDKDNIQSLWECYRQEFIPTAGICLVVFGNKKDKDNNIVPATGVRREFEIAKEIAKEKGLKIVPVGATGYVAKKIWEEMKSSFDEYYPNSNQDLKEKFNKLNDEEKPSELINSILEFISSITNH